MSGSPGTSLFSGGSKIRSLFLSKPTILLPLHTAMQKSVAILATALVLPAIAGIAWMLAPSPLPLSENEQPAKIRASVSPATASQTSGTAATAATISRPGVTRPADDHFPEAAPAPSPSHAAQLPAPPPATVSPRYTLTTQPNAAALVRRLANQPPLLPDERIRVLPADVVPGNFTAAAKPVTAAGVAATQPQGTPAEAILLRLDATLHDPVAWVEDGKPRSVTQTEVTAKIADEFSAEVAAAAKQPETAGRSFDEAWQSAREKANRNYAKFFGADAANRAGVNAGRAAAARQ